MPPNSRMEAVANMKRKRRTLEEMAADGVVGAAAKVEAKAAKKALDEADKLARKAARDAIKEVKKQESAYTHWVFTVFEGSHPSFPAPLVITDDIGYMTYQLEKAPETGNLHFQGYVEFNKPIRLSALKKRDDFFATCYLKQRFASQEQASRYTLKDDTAVPASEGGFRVEYGIRARVGASRAYDAMVKSVVDNTFVPAEHAHEYIRHFRGVEALQRSMTVVSVKDWEITDIADQLYPYQQEILDIVKGPVNNRKVYWYWSREGGVGKSAFCNHLVKYERAIVLETTKRERVIRAYNHEPIVVFDIERDAPNVEAFNYTIIEMFHNGRGFNTMYDPGMKVFNVPHVIVFANFAPRLDALSSDRWFVKCLDKPIFDASSVISLVESSL